MVKNLPLVRVKPYLFDVTIIFKPIFAKPKLPGAKHFYVEQDAAPSPIQNLTNSYNYLRKTIG
jgi:hypothetical protein